MANFSSSSVEVLEYDFRDFASNSGKGSCKGHGEIPEPTSDALEAYGAATRELFKVETNKDVKEKLEDDDAAKAKSRELLKLTADLCENSPSVEELEDLPPRIQRAFFKWIFKEITDPEVSSGATPR